MVFCCDESVLKVEGGRFLMVYKSKYGPRLCASEVQNGLQDVTKVQIERRVQNQRNQIALHCKVGRHSYTLKVVEGTLKLEINQNSDDLPDRWFEKVNTQSSEYYCLRSVADPVKYLSISQNWFCVSYENNCIQVTDISL